MDGALLDFLGGPRCIAVPFGEKQVFLRVISAYELLQAKQEAKELAQGEEDMGLCMNACVLARAMEGFSSGKEVLECFSASQVLFLIEAFGELNRQVNPSACMEEGQVEALKKAWDTPPTNASNGVSSKLLGRFRLNRGQRK